MKHLVTDYLWRWKWVFFASFVLHMACSAVGWHTGYANPVFVLSGSAFLLQFEWARGGQATARTLLALPLTPRAVARAWRFVGLEFPALLFGISLALSFPLAEIFHASKLPSSERFVMVTLLQTLLLGTIFFAFTALPRGQGELQTWYQRLQGATTGLLWGFSIPGCMFLHRALPPTFAGFSPWHWLTALAMTAATVAGWSRAEGLVLRRAQSPHRVPPSAPSPSRKAVLTRGFGGIPYHLAHFARISGLIGLTFVLLNWVTLRFFFHRASGEPQALVTASQITFASQFTAFLLAVGVLQQLRFYRSLPLSRASIAALAVLWPLAFAITFALIATLAQHLCFGGPIHWSQFASSVAGTSFLLLAIPALMALGFTGWGFFVFAIGLFLYAFWQRDSSPLTWVGSTASALVSYALVYHILHSSRPWRAGALRFAGQRRF